MEGMNTVGGMCLIVVYIVAGLLLFSMVNTFIHEAGHAIAIMLLTRCSVSVYLGTYGDQERSRRIGVGKSEVWIIRNLLRWKGGLCVPHADDISFGKQILYTLAGPFASLLLSMSLLSVYLVYHPTGLYEPFLIAFSIAAGYSFLYNLVPRRAASSSMNGQLVYNDGAQIRKLLDLKSHPPEFNEAAGLFNEKRFEEAIALLDKVIECGTKRPDIYRLAIDANMMVKQYSRADRLQKQQVEKIGHLTTHDRINMGLLKTHLKKYDEAIGYYKHLLQLYGKDKYNLNNLAYTLTLVGRYEEAIPYADQAIAIDNQFASAYTNRAFAKLNNGMLEDGRKDNDISLQLDDTESYAHRNAGIYCFQMWRYEEAMTHFERARELDPDTPLVDKYIEETRGKMGG